VRRFSRRAVNSVGELITKGVLSDSEETVSDSTIAGISVSSRPVKHYVVWLSLIIAASILCLLARAVFVGVFTRDESFFAEGAREMLVANKLLVPMFYNYTVFDKPVLNDWWVIGAYKILGESLLAARLPSVVASGICLWAVAATTRRIFDDHTALLSAAVLGSSMLLLEMGASCMSDMVLCLFEFVGLSLFYFAMQNEGRKKILFLVASSIFIALAFLQKGLPGLVLPGIAVAAYSILFRCKIRVSEMLYAGLVFLLVIAPWHIAIFKMAGVYSFYYMYFHEAIGRFLGHSQPYNFGHPWYYMSAALLSALLPWSVFLPLVFAGLRNDWQRRDTSPSVQFLALMVLVTLVHVVFFSISKSNWGYYNLPALPGMAILIAVYCRRYLLILSEKIKLPITNLPVAMFVCALMASMYISVTTWPAKAAKDPANSFSAAFRSLPKGTELVCQRELAGQTYLLDLLIFRTEMLPKYVDDGVIRQGLSSNRPFCAVTTKHHFERLKAELGESVIAVKQGEMKYLNFPGCALTDEAPPGTMLALCLVTNSHALPPADSSSKQSTSDK
jgi:4-amino-4-deoxy-L-arabinose transferase-like glycosyltransferase